MSEYYLTKDELLHYGIKGQKWGIRRFENPDGTLTPAGKERYLKNSQNPNSKKKIFKDKLNSPKVKKAIKIGLAIAGTAIAAYGAYKAYQFVSDKSDVIQRGRLQLAEQKERGLLDKWMDDYRVAKLVSDPETKSKLMRKADQSQSELAQAANIRKALEDKYNDSSNLEKIKDSYKLLKANKKQQGISYRDSYKKYKEMSTGEWRKKKQW